MNRAQSQTSKIEEYMFYEFFAGGGMVSAALRPKWGCVFANDFDAMKAATYRENWGGEHLICADVASLKIGDLPGTADLAWASFPCQDLSLAGDGRGMGRANSGELTRSGTFWPFWRLIEGLVADRRSPRLIVLENVYGAITCRGGQDFAAIASALESGGYRFGAVVINAKFFVPQSRPRVFFIAAREDQKIPSALQGGGPEMPWHPKALALAYARMSSDCRLSWVWWTMPLPKPRKAAFADIIDPEPVGTSWHSTCETRHILGMMSRLNKRKVEIATQAKSRVVGGVYRRTRPDNNGVSRQRAEVRFDDIAGCLRTPAGGSSRQTILVIENGEVRSRLLSPREAARLMGLRDSYKLPDRYNDAYHVAGDGVCVPVVKHLAVTLLEPILKANGREALLAA